MIDEVEQATRGLTTCCVVTARSGVVERVGGTESATKGRVREQEFRSLVSEEPLARLSAEAHSQFLARKSHVIGNDELFFSLYYYFVKVTNRSAK